MQPELKHNGDWMSALILLPTGRDAQLVSDILAKLQLKVVVCRTVQELLGHIDETCGLFVVAQEAMPESSIKLLAIALDAQPEWSELPGILLGGPAVAGPISTRHLAARRQIMLIQRPVRKSIFIQIINSAIEVRRRQFQVRDLIEDLVQTNAALRNRSNQLQKLALEMTRVEDRERSRIAQILHDDLQQMLASARLQTEMLFDHLNGDATQRVQTVYDILTQSMQAARNLSHELNPAVSKNDRLEHSLKQLADKMSHNYSLTIQTDLNAENFDIPDDIKRFVYRSVQELLFNCAKHSQADRISLNMVIVDKALTVTLTDNGVGFNPGMLKVHGGDQEGYGLFSIQERITALDGALEIHSRPGEGSRFKLKIPCPDQGNRM